MIEIDWPVQSNSGIITFTPEFNHMIRIDEIWLSSQPIYASRCRYCACSGDEAFDLFWFVNVYYLNEYGDTLFDRMAKQLKHQSESFNYQNLGAELKSG